MVELPVISPNGIPGPVRIPESMPANLSVPPVHTRVRGRSRFKVAQLYRSREWKHRLESGLAGVDGITAVHANVLTGSLLVVFDPQRTVMDIARLIGREMARVQPVACPRSPALPGMGSQAGESRSPVLHFTALPAAFPVPFTFFALPFAFLRTFIRGSFHASPILLSLTLAIILMGQVIGKKEGWSRTDALYFSFMTASTIGYGDLHPTKKSTKLLTVGIGIVGLLLTGVVAALGVHATQEAFKNLP